MDAIAEASPTRQEAPPRVGKPLPSMVHNTAMSCASRQFVVTAFGDGDSDLSRDMKLARARAEPIVSRLSNVKYRRVDTLVFAGPHLAHPSTLAIHCPTDHLPEQASF